MNLPSRFQIGDEVSIHGTQGVVEEVEFKLSKVTYGVRTKYGVYFADSDDVHPRIQLRAVK